MTECKNCPYFIDNNNGYPYCCLYCSDIDFIIIHDLCKIIKKPMNDCKKCEKAIINMFGIGCSEINDWITHQEYKNGKVKLDSCPKERK